MESTYQFDHDSFPELARFRDDHEIFVSSGAVGIQLRQLRYLR